MCDRYCVTVCVCVRVNDNVCVISMSPVRERELHQGHPPLPHTRTLQSHPALHLCWQRLESLGFTANHCTQVCGMFVCERVTRKWDEESLVSVIDHDYNNYYYLVFL